MLAEALASAGIPAVEVKPDPEAPLTDKNGKNLSIGDKVKVLDADGAVAATATVEYTKVGTRLHPVDNGKVSCTLLVLCNHRDQQCMHSWWLQASQCRTA